MTALEPGKKVDRIVPVFTIGGRRLVVRVNAGGLLIKVEGQRWSSARTVDWTTLYGILAPRAHRARRVRSIRRRGRR